MVQLPDGTDIENWTSIVIKLIDLATGETVIIPVEEEGPARVHMDHNKVEGRRYITRTIFAEKDNLPPPRKGVFLIVSGVIKSLYADRDDLVVPNRVIRGEPGVLACQGFAI